MKKTILLIALIVSVITMKAQDPHFSQFFASPLTLNPAFTGKFDGEWRLVLMESKSERGIGRAPEPGKGG